MSEFQSGAIWRSKDKRENRTVRVEGFQRDDRVWISNTETGRSSVVRWRNFFKTYEPVSEVSS